MDYILSILIGYLMGCVNPTHLISKIKGIDIHTSGTGNPGASNATIVFGRTVGLLVLIFDIFKSFFAVIICSLLFKKTLFSGLVGGCFAVIGHCFPIHHKFKGGKGLASLVGMMLAVNPLRFFIIAIFCCILTIICNHICVLPISASAVFAFSAMYQFNSIIALLIGVLCFSVILIRHIPNIEAAFSGNDEKVRDFLKRKFIKN